MEFIPDQLVYFGFLQCVFLLLIYAFSKRARQSINPYLVILLLVLLVGLSGQVMYRMGVFGRPYKLLALSEYATFLFGATVYLFTKSSLFNQNLNRKDLWHYLPGVLWICVHSWYFMFSSDDFIAKRLGYGELYWMVVIFMGAGLIVNWTYLILSIRLVQSYLQSAMNELSFTIRIKFLKSFLWSIGVCLLLWLVVYFIGVFGQSWLERTVRPIIWLSLAYIILFLSYYTIKEPALFKWVPLEIKPKKYQNSKLTLGELEDLKQKLAQVMVDKKPYLNRNLMKRDLAEMLGVSSPEVARLLNELIGMNFFEYVNYYRIKEFVELAKTDKAKTLTFFALAQEAGFNSKTTFNKSFKKIMGSSPREYFNQSIS